MEVLVRTGVLVAVGDKLAVDVGTAASARPFNAIDWLGRFSALLLMDIFDLKDPFAGGEKRTVTERVPPGDSENDPSPEEIENGKSGNATLPEIVPPSARSVKDSSCTPPLK